MRVQDEAAQRVRATIADRYPVQGRDSLCRATVLVIWHCPAPVHVLRGHLIRHADYVTTARDSHVNSSLICC